MSDYVDTTPRLWLNGQLEVLERENADLRQQLADCEADRAVAAGALRVCNKKFVALGSQLTAAERQAAEAQAREQSVLKTAAIVDNNLCAAIDDKDGDENTLLGAMLNAHIDLAMLQRDQPDHAALGAALAAARRQGCEEAVRQQLLGLRLPVPIDETIPGGNYDVGFEEGIKAYRRAIRAVLLEEDT